jgi:hypothetical protein
MANPQPDIDGRYNGFAIGQQAITVEGYLVEVIDLTVIESGAPYALIPHTVPRVAVKALRDYDTIAKGDVGHYDPSHLKAVISERDSHYADAAQLRTWRQERG